MNIAHQHRAWRGGTGSLWAQVREVCEDIRWAILEHIFQTVSEVPWGPHFR